MEQTPKVMTDLLRGLDCKVWVDDVFYFAEDGISLLYLLDEIFSYVCIVWIRVLERSCLARMATRCMVLCLEE